jgi:pimeloyl-ACP methyl ester carboxylesterase
MKNRVSEFRNTAEAAAWLNTWSMKVQQFNNAFYLRKEIATTFGKTIVWTWNLDRTNLETIVFFPGARTCAFFWDLNNVLEPLRKNFRIILVEVIGQANLSDGYSPDIKTDEYGIWVRDLFSGLNISKAVIAGASLGGLICLKACRVVPHLISRAILVNPAGLRSFSGLPGNVFYNMLPIIFPRRSNVEAFLKNVVFYKDVHTLPRNYFDLVVDYQEYVLKNHKFRGDYPEPLPSHELQKINSPVYLITGDRDNLFPYQRSVENARKYLKNLKRVEVLKDIAHGIETSEKAIEIIRQIVCETENEMVVTQR